MYHDLAVREQQRPGARGILRASEAGRRSIETQTTSVRAEGSEGSGLPTGQPAKRHISVDYTGEAGN